MSFLRSIKVTGSTLLVLIGAALLSAPLYVAFLPVEVQGMLTSFTAGLLNILLLAGFVYVFFNWMFDSWRLGKKFVAVINLTAGLSVIVLGVGLLVNSYLLGLWDGAFTAEHAAMVALVALGAGLADRSYVTLRYLTGKPVAPAHERLGKEEIVEAAEDLTEAAEAKVAELTS